MKICRRQCQVAVVVLWLMGGYLLCGWIGLRVLLRFFHCSLVPSLITGLIIMPHESSKRWWRGWWRRNGRIAPPASRELISPGGHWRWASPTIVRRVVLLYLLWSPWRFRISGISPRHRGRGRGSRLRLRCQSVRDDWPWLGLFLVHFISFFVFFVFFVLSFFIIIVSTWFGFGKGRGGGGNIGGRARG